MTLIARLPNSSEQINPAILVRTGKESARRLDKELKGGTYYCPFCEGFREQIRPIGRITETFAALERMSMNVNYRCAHYTPLDEIKKLMHFAHPCGTAQQIRQLYGVDVHQGYNSNHDLAVLSFIELLREEYPKEKGYELKREKLLKLDVPPLKRRPDIVVYKGTEVILVVEVQLSHQSFKDFQTRNEHLLLIAPKVKWFIYKNIYNRMADHRRWLSDRDIRYDQFWTDKETGKLLYDIGKPPKQRSSSSKTTTLISDGSCSIARRIGLSASELEVEAWLQQKKNQPPDIQVGKPEYSPSHQITSKKPSLPPPVNYQIGDLVEVYTRRRWEQGEVIGLTEVRLPIVRIAGRRPRRHPAFGFEYVRMLKPKSLSPEPVFEQGTLFDLF